MSMIGYVKRVDSVLASQLQKGEGETSDLYTCSTEDAEMNVCLELDKTWDGIDFLVQNGNRRNNPNSAFLGAKKSAYLKEELGYGPAMLISMNEVTRVAEELEKISDEEFSKRCSTHYSALIEQEVYPFAEGETLEEVESYLAPYFKDLRELFREAAKAGDSVLYWVM